MDLDLSRILQVYCSISLQDKHYFWNELNWMSMSTNEIEKIIQPVAILCMHDFTLLLFHSSISLSCIFHIQLNVMLRPDVSLFLSCPDPYENIGAYGKFMDIRTIVSSNQYCISSSYNRYLCIPLSSWKGIKTRFSSVDSKTPYPE